MSWHNGPFLAFDTETTGVNCDTDRIVTATTVWIDGADLDTTSWLIDPGVEIPEAAAAVHGITTEHARAHGRPPVECVGEIANQLASAWNDGVPVLAFNASYDLTILDREMRRHGLTEWGLQPSLVLDPFVIDKAVDRYRKGKRTLETQCAHYGVTHGGAHDATADALAAARVMWRIARRFPEVGAMSLEELHDAQVHWAAEQAASFRDYLIRQGRTDDLPTGEWPMRAHAPAVAA
ncbi:3'-5' exonuclease [Geodermatophilus chilensis]|uniref:3'-5' exonuclease n=1 Tax=Geodermatophilus chilensis TaxID=2035835 RepID=UPI000C25C8E9|nr:3'-5' exonuclease [Geodermatophilus chilensis]